MLGICWLVLSHRTLHGCYLAKNTIQLLNTDFSRHSSRVVTMLIRPVFTHTLDLITQCCLDLLFHTTWNKQSMEDPYHDYIQVCWFYCEKIHTHPVFEEWRFFFPLSENKLLSKKIEKKSSYWMSTTDCMAVHGCLNFHHILIESTWIHHLQLQIPLEDQSLPSTIFNKHLLRTHFGLNTIAEMQLKKNIIR